MLRWAAIIAVTSGCSLLFDARGQLDELPPVDAGRLPDAGGTFDAGEENPPQIDFFNAMPAAPQLGQPVIVQWRVQNADEVFLTRTDVPSVPEAVSLQGTFDFIAEMDSNFELRAVRGNLETTALLRVLLSSGAPSIDHFAFQQDVVDWDVPAVVTWGTSGAQTVQLLDANGGIIFTSTSLDEARSGAYVFGTAVGRSTFTLNAQGDDGEVVVSPDQTLTRRARPQDAELFLLEAPPRAFDPGVSLSLVWDVTLGATVRLFVNGNEVMADDANSYETIGSETTTFLLQAQFPGGALDEHRFTSYLIIPEMDQGMLNPQPIDGFAVRGDLVEKVPNSDFFSVVAEADERLVVSMSECDASTDLRVTQGADSMFATGLQTTCPLIDFPVRQTGPVLIEVSTNVAQTDAYVLVADRKPPECGNGLIENGEICDDGNRVPGDGCDEQCTPRPTIDHSVATIPGAMRNRPANAVRATLHPVSRNGSTALDEGVAYAALPNAVAFAGREYNGAIIHTNGFMTLLPLEDILDTEFPLDGGGPHAVISLFGADLDLDDAELWYWFDMDQALVVEYVQAKLVQEPSITLSGQMVLARTGEVTMIYTELPDAAPVEFQVGLEGPRGVSIVTPACAPCSVEELSQGSFRFTP